MNSRILIVHGCGTHRDRIRKHLQRRAHSVTSANNWADAFELARGKQFDLIVYDDAIPTIDGEEMMRRIRAISHHSATPALSLTRESCVTMVSGAVDPTLNMYMPAEYEISQLTANIDALLGLVDTQQRLIA